jgi:hypothetical protein
LDGILCNSVCVILTARLDGCHQSSSFITCFSPVTYDSILTTLSGHSTEVENNLTVYCSQYGPSVIFFPPQILLAVASVAIADVPSPTAATTTTGNSATPRTSLRVDKGKRTTSAESNPLIGQYPFPGDDQPTRYVPQQYVQPQSAKPQAISYVPLKSAPEQKREQIPEKTFTVQYVPAQQISHSFDSLPRYEPTPKYQLLSKIQQEPVKASAPSQNPANPQQLYIIPASSPGFARPDLYSTPQYTPTPAAYLHSVPTYTPGHHIFNPVSNYLVPQHSAAAYSLQPVVMMFTLPGGHYLNSAAGQNALLSLLHGAGNLGSASSGSSAASAYVVPRQHPTYYIPTVAHPAASQVSEILIDRRLHRSCK